MEEELAMADNQYLYEVARIRTKELSLLSAEFFEQLLSAPDYDACIRLLKEKGWESGRDDWEEMLAKERQKTWELMEELVGDTSVFDVFLYANDYSNLKAAVKSCRHRTELSNIYIDQGTVPVSTIRTAVLENRFEDLPEAMREPAREAQTVLLQTSDGQLCDVIIDRAALEAVYRAGKESGNEFLRLYGELTVACADIKIAVRASRTGKSREFLGEGKVTGLEADGRVLPCVGVFLLRSAVAPTQLLPGLELEGPYIRVDRNMATSIPGVFAAGDCTGLPLQVSKAVGEGLVAGLRCAEYLDRNSHS